MRRPERWESLVRTLRDRGHESPYLDRLRARLDAFQAMDDLEAEILREKAAALGRAEDKINAALLELELIERDLDARPVDDPARGERIAAYNRQRDVAARAVWELQVHREALGLYRHDALRELYPVPPRRRPD